jgi:hypothetical protein
MPRYPVPPPIASDADSRPARYRAVHWEAVTSLVLAALSPIVVLHWVFTAVPGTAILLGWLALRKIDRAPEEYTGQRMAWIGIRAAAVVLILGVVWLVIRGNPVPPGYRRVDYSELAIDPKAPQEIIPPRVKEELEGKNIYIEGYMVPGRQHLALTRFVLCRTSDQCRFKVPTPEKRELIRIECTGDMTVDYSDRLVGVGGRLRTDPNEPHGMPYLIEADYFR